MKRAIIYYSLTGNTMGGAEKLAELLDADIYRIETIKPMPSDKTKQMMIGGMKAIFGMCPEIKGVPENTELYDEFIIGTPIWAGKHAPAVNTLLKNKKITEKITAVFTFSGGGDNDKCIEILTKMLPKLNHTAALADRSPPVKNRTVAGCRIVRPFRVPPPISIRANCAHVLVLIIQLADISPVILNHQVA